MRLTAEGRPRELCWRATSAAVRAVADKPAATVSYGGGPAAVSGTEVTLPQPSRALPLSEVACVRGEADAAALRLRYHDERLHRHRRPAGPTARAVFDAVEQVRVEALGARRMAGVAANLQPAAADRCRRQGFEAAHSRDEIPLAEVMRLLAREALAGEPRPANGQRAVELWKAGLPGQIRRELAELGRLVGDQDRFASALVRIITNLHLSDEARQREEPPGEEGFPAYLGSRLAAFYERAGRVAVLGSPERTGSITLVGAVSPPGGDFSEPVTQASLRLAGTFWALDAELAHARHFPAIGWDRSYSLYVAALGGWYAASVAADWAELRAEAIALLSRERQLLDIVQLVGADALPDEDRVVLEVARLLREAFLQQHAFDPVDAARPLAEQIGLLRAVGMTRSQLRSAIRWESVIIAPQGTLLGLLVGLFFGWALVRALHDEGLTVFRVPYGSVLAIVLLAALAGMIAAVSPSRRAAKLDVLQAIVSE